MKISNVMRKLEDSSWLAQIIQDKMDVEAEERGYTPRWKGLQVLLIIVREADSEDNENIYHSTIDGKRQIIIRDIPSMVSEYGLDFDREGMRNKLRGLAARYTDDNGQYIVSVLTTNDLNSATINDISELLYQMSF